MHTLVEDNVFPLGWILSASAVTSFISLSALQSLVPLSCYEFKINC